MKRRLEELHDERIVIRSCHHIPFGCQIKGDETDGTCDGYGAEDK